MPPTAPRVTHRDPHGERPAVWLPRGRGAAGTRPGVGDERRQHGAGHACYSPGPASVGTGTRVRPALSLEQRKRDAARLRRGPHARRAFSGALGRRRLPSPTGLRHCWTVTGAALLNPDNPDLTRSTASSGAWRLLQPVRATRSLDDSGDRDPRREGLPAATARGWQDPRPCPLRVQRSSAGSPLSRLRDCDTACPRPRRGVEANTRLETCSAEGRVAAQAWALPGHGSRCRGARRTVYPQSSTAGLRGPRVLCLPGSPSTPPRLKEVAARPVPKRGRTRTLECRASPRSSWFPWRLFSTSAKPASPAPVDTWAGG